MASEETLRDLRELRELGVAIATYPEFMMGCALAIVGAHALGTESVQRLARCVMQFCVTELALSEVADILGGQSGTGKN